VAGFGDPRIIYLRQEHSGLPSVARNTGLRQARGKYIGFLDSDDQWTEDKLAVQVAYLDAHPEVGLCYTNYWRFTDDPNRSEPLPVLRHTETFSGHAFEEMYGRQRIPNLTVMIRASVIEEVGYLDEDPRLKANEDYEYWLRIAERHPIGYIDQPLAKYRLHPSGISKSGVDNYLSKLALVETLDKMYPEFVAGHLRDRRRWLARIRSLLGFAYLRDRRLSVVRRLLLASQELLPRLPTALQVLVSYFGGEIYRLFAGMWMRLPKG
jgi:glycosyltransferase involved in cell wall biosynthesis